MSRTSAAPPRRLLGAAVAHELGSGAEVPQPHPKGVACIFSEAFFVGVRVCTCRCSAAVCISA